MAGKGSKPRPFSVTQKQFGNNWDNIFKKKFKDESTRDDLSKDWYLVAINPWYKFFYNPITNKQKQVPYK